VSAAEPRETEDRPSATVKGALFLLNDDRLLKLLAPRGENLAGRLAKCSDPTALSDELYVSVLSRMPTDAERQEVAAFLLGRGENRDAALRDLVWALVSSSEFGVNH
jgi:hypothetical protein